MFTSHAHVVGPEAMPEVRVSRHGGSLAWDEGYHGVSVTSLSADYLRELAALCLALADRVEQSDEEVAA